MKRAKIISVILATLMAGCLIGNSAWAGSRQRHIWEGIAIGTAAVVVADLLLDGSAYCCQYRPAPAYRAAPMVYYTPPPVYIVPSARAFKRFERRMAHRRHHLRRWREKHRRHGWHY